MINKIHLNPEEIQRSFAETTKYICGITPYKRPHWFKRILIWLGFLEDTNLRNSFELIILGDFKKGDCLKSVNGAEIYIYKKCKKQVSTI